MVLVAYSWFCAKMLMAVSAQGTKPEWAASKTSTFTPTLSPISQALCRIMREGLTPVEAYKTRIKGTQVSKNVTKKRVPEVEICRTRYSSRNVFKLTAEVEGQKKSGKDYFKQGLLF